MVIPQKCLFNKKQVRRRIVLQVNSTLSDYMITIFQDRLSGMDFRNPGSMDGIELTVHGTGFPLPGGYDVIEHNLTK
jgi:hypothetical protein